jgi:hypothetical protein
MVWEAKNPRQGGPISSASGEPSWAASQDVVSETDCVAKQEARKIQGSDLLFYNNPLIMVPQEL